MILIMKKTLVNPCKNNDIYVVNDVSLVKNNDIYDANYVKPC